MKRKDWEKESKKKLIDPKKLSQWSKNIKKQKKTIVSLNGSFDLMHAGHLFLIYEAKKQGDVLIVALNSDASIKKYKSQNRPIVHLKYRIQMMAALEFVDYVTWFDETDPREVLKKINPDVHVNGKEYTEDCIEAETVKKLGARLHLIERVGEGVLSTSDIIKRINKCV